MDTFVNALGCDSILTLILTVNPIVTSTITQSVCQGSSYLGYTASGTYVDTFVNALGCDSIRTLILTVNPIVTSTITQSICQGSSYLGYNQSGTYVDTFINGAGCDSIRTLILTVNPIVTSTITQSICQGSSYLGYNQSGTYVDTFINGAGCDSIRTLILTVNPIVTSTITQSICQGSSYLGYNQSGTYVDTFINGAGCDSIRTLYLTVLPPTTAIDVVFICANQVPFTWNGLVNAQNGAVYTTVGSNGCDSLTTLNLTVNPVYAVADSQTICAHQLPYTWNGMTNVQSGAVYQTSSTMGCDSTVTLALTVNPDVTNNIDTVICHNTSFQWGSLNLDASGVYTQAFNTSLGCDSVVTMTLEVRSAPIADSQSLEGCGFYVYNGVTYTRDTIITYELQDAYGCDSFFSWTKIDVLEFGYDTVKAAICQGEVYRFFDNDYTTTGLYNYVTPGNNGCDSTITLDLNVNPLPVVILSVSTQSNHGFCMGDSVTVLAEGAKYYVWENGYDQVLGTGDSVTSVLPEENNFIQVTGTDTSGCVDTAVIVIASEPCCLVMIPNAFSPNGDGLNDKFGPVTDGHPQDYQMQIFNRWGQCVFVSFKVEDQWDGMMNGKDADIGTYHYYITGRCRSGENLNESGDLILIR